MIQGEPEVGHVVCKIGGPAYRIGMGGGAASSRVQVISTIFYYLYWLIIHYQPQIIQIVVHKFMLSEWLIISLFIIISMMMTFLLIIRVETQQKVHWILMLCSGGMLRWKIE